VSIHGQKGSIEQWDGSAWVKIVQTTGWTLNITQQTAEAAVQEEEYITRAAGAKDWNASIEGLAQADRKDGNLVNFMVPEDDIKAAAGKIRIRLRNSREADHALYEGKGFFTDVSVSSPEGGLVTVSATLAGRDILVYNTPAKLVLPGAPQRLRAASTQNTITLTWEASDDKGFAITKYQRRHKKGDGNFGSWTDVSGGGTARTVTISGLSASSEYTVELRPVSAKGNGAAASVTISTTAS